MTAYLQILRKTSPLAVAAAAISLSSCALPPDVAWHRIQTEGLIPFVAETIQHPLREAPPEEVAAVRRSHAPATPPATTSTSAIASTTPSHAAPAATTTPAPAPAPAITKSTPASAPSDLNPKVDQHPMVAKSVPSLPGFVRSPYTNPPRLVDAKGATPGSTMICPYTQRPFIVPNDFANPSSSVASSTFNSSPAPMPTPRSAPPTIIAKNDVLPQTPAGSLFNNSAPKTNGNATAAAKPATANANIPYGIPIPGRPGFVNSPYAAKHQLVDVTGLPPGMEVKCPYTGKLFRVPSSDVVQQKADSTSNVAAPESPQKK